MSKITYQLSFDKSTKNMHVYVHPEKKGVTAYLPKSDFPTAPAQLQATFEMSDATKPANAKLTRAEEEDGL